ncbi:hypothetical protein EAI_16857, partial [Harpegnathos saltator]
FHPDLCHVCKLAKKDVVLCNSCMMITYCCIEHKILHLLQHVDFCRAIQMLPREYLSLNIRRSNVETWIESKEHLLQLVENLVGRPLYLYEVQILMFTKQCLLVCPQQNNLLTCPACLSVSYC